MAGLREQKRRKTFGVIHEAAMDLFARKGYANVTVADIAEAAEVSRATVFTYYPAKEDIVLGESPLALESLAQALEGLDERSEVVVAVRDWLRTLVGWLEPDLLLQTRLAAEVTAIGAARSRFLRDIEGVIAAALTRAMGEGSRLGARLVAGSLIAALVTAEQEAVERMVATGRPLADEEVDALLDAAVAFIDGGLARL